MKAHDLRSAHMQSFPRLDRSGLPAWLHALTLGAVLVSGCTQEPARPAPEVKAQAPATASAPTAAPASNTAAITSTAPASNAASAPVTEKAPASPTAAAGDYALPVKKAADQKLSCCDAPADSKVAGASEGKIASSSKGSTAAAEPLRPPEEVLRQAAALIPLPEPVQSAPVAALPPLPAPSQRDSLDRTVTFSDQTGKDRTLADFEGKPLVVSFFFTRCSNPQMCPMITAKMMSLQRELETAGLSKSVNLALISYDQKYDVPAVLQAYATQRNLKLENLTLLHPHAEKYRDLMDSFQLQVSFDGLSIANHSMDLYILDPRLKLARQYRGLWSNALVLQDLKQVLAE